MMKSIIGFLAFLAFLPSFSQELIPIHSWRTHFSYNEVVSLTQDDTKIFAAAKKGIIIYDSENEEVTTLTPLDGIHNSEISSISYLLDYNILAVGHTDGIIDLVSDEVVKIIDLAADLRATKKINDFYFQNHLLYISTDLGILVYNLNENFFTATYDQLGPTGDDIMVNDVTILNNEIFAATNEGIISGSLEGANLNDFREWKRYNNINSRISNIEFFNGNLYAAAENEGILVFDGKNWVNTGHLNQESFESLSAASDKLIITTSQDVFFLNIENQLNIQDDPAINIPKDALMGNDGAFYIAEEGLIIKRGENVQVIKPQGPEVSIDKLEVSNNILYALPAGSYKNNDASLAAFIEGRWFNYKYGNSSLEYNIPEVKNVYDIAYFQNKLYISSMSDKPLVIDGENKYFLNGPFSTFIGEIKTTGLLSARDKLWIINYGTAQPLISYDGSSFQSYSLMDSHILDIIESPDGKLVLRTESNGIIVFDPITGAQRLLNTGDNQGELPSNNVNDMVYDTEGRLWVATTAGVAYFSSSVDLYSVESSIVPIFEFRQLFRNVNVTALAVDGGGRKWFGTTTGVWLFNNDITKEIYHFTTETSPLLGSKIEDIILLQNTGEVFFATNNGLISFRSGASTPGAVLDEIKIFPNPVYPGFNGTIGFSGLAANAVLKITDINGNLLYQSKANGSTATWNLQDNHGERVNAGVYLVFTAKEDGSESLAGKIAVLR